MKATAENKMELLEQYARDIYMATCHAIPHPEKRPKIKDIKRLPHEALVSNYALILEFIIRIKNESSILLQIINDESFKPYSLEEFSKNFDKLAAKIKDWELREYLKRCSALSSASSFLSIKSQISLFLKNNKYKNV